MRRARACHVGSRTHSVTELHFLHLEEEAAAFWDEKHSHSTGAACRLCHGAVRRGWAHLVP